ncbi:MAG: MlrC C-terminal domain-containing protein, partial [Pseudomonadota bacterium]
VPLGMCSVLEVGGNRVVLISACQQLLGEDFISQFGIDVAKASFIVAKSRGHFRAGFSHLVPSERIFEVDSPGLTTATLASVPWKDVSRPIAPLDAVESWEPSVLAVSRRQ